MNPHHVIVTLCEKVFGVLIGVDYFNSHVTKFVCKRLRAKAIIKLAINVKNITGIKHLKKLAKYYELVVYTILPGDILEQIFDMVPGIRDVISHSLCYNELIFVFIGCFEAMLSDELIHDIKLKLYNVNFFEFQTEYDSNITDVPSTILKIHLDGRKHEVTDRFNGPLELKSVHVLIDHYVDSIIKWNSCEILE